MAGMARSAKDLWSLVSGVSILNCKELVEYELEENKEHILNGILHFKKSNNASSDVLQKSVEAHHFEFVSKLSKLLDVDAMQCYEVFVSYATYEYKGTQKTLEAQLSSERHMHSLLLEVWNYYFSERLYYLLILKHIMGHWQDDSDPYKDLYERFLEKTNKDNVVVTKLLPKLFKEDTGPFSTKIINQLEDSISLELPIKDTHGPFMTDTLTHHWITYILKEQCELLQLLLLYYKVMEHTLTDFQQMFSVFQTHGFGSRQSFRLYINEENQHLIDMIGYLEGFVFVQCLELEWLFKCCESEMLKEHFLLKDENAVQVLDDAIQTLGSQKVHSPIMLAWMLAGYCLPLPDIKKKCGRMGSMALQLGVFDHLVAALESLEFSGPGVVPTVVNRVAYGLLSVLLSKFELQNLGSLKPILSIAKSVLRYPSVASDFWEKGLDAGMGCLLKYSIEMFPLEFCTVLDLCESLATAGTDSCQKVLDCLKIMPVFTDYMENIDERDIEATEDVTIWRLIRSKPIFGDNSLMIPQGTLGLVIKDADKNGSSIIQWHAVINGWQICLHELHSKLQEISVSIAFTTEEGINRITTIGKLVHSILRTDLGNKALLIHIINVLFSTMQRYVNHSSPPVKLLATCIDVFATLLQDWIPDIWQKLVQINFTPFMASFPKSVPELASGINMSMGIVDHLIASKECVSGKYPLCLSFLSLIENVSRNLLEDDDNFLCCLVYILREIFSYFHKWFYVDPREKLLIGEKCLNILHNVFSVETEKRESLAKAQELCIHSLLRFEAGQTLLKIVCTGEETIQQTVLKQNCALGDQVASMIRLSLSVLNRLLLLRNAAAPTKTSKAEISPLESVLFSTPGHSTQPQVVLMVAQYVFQRYNPRLATLAVQLLKRFAKEFPMSLLACFGSEAEAIRDHFLARLSSPSEDIRLKVSILEFLTVCVAQQPGLIEMFINLRSDVPSHENKKEEMKSCLECVKHVLRNSIEENEYKRPQNICCAAVEFIHALWAGHQALAMEALKKDPEFWNLLCGNLLTEKFKEDNPRINAYIIRTLGLEVFYGTATRNVLNEHVKRILSTIVNQNCLIKWSEHVNSICPSADDDDSILPASSKSFANEFQDALDLLTAWRDFILILASYGPIHIEYQIKAIVMKHILDNFAAQISHGNSRLLILLSELFLMLSHHWRSELVEKWDNEQWNGASQSIYTILKEVANNTDAVHPRVQLAVISIAISTIKCVASENRKIKNLKDWIAPTCQLLKKASLLVHKPLQPENIGGILKLPITVICLLNGLLQQSIDWLPVIHLHTVLPLLVSLLIKSLKLEAGVELSHAIIILFISLASNKKAAEALYNTGFMVEVTLILSDIKFNFEDSQKEISMISHKPKLSKVSVYFTFLRLMTTLLHVLGSYFLQDCLNFVGIHQENMHASLKELKITSSPSGISDAVLTSALVHQLSFHRQMWQLHHPRSLHMLLVNVCDSIHSTISILSKPGLLKHLVEHKKLPSAKSNLSAENLSLKRLSSEDDGTPSNEVLAIQQKLFELLAVTLSVLKQYCPKLYETMSGHAKDLGEWQLLLHVGFSIPSVDQEGPLSFGTILACINMCLKVLVKNEKTPSPIKSTESTMPVERHLLMYVLETSLTILLSQSSIALSRPDLPQRDKQLIRRELAAELNSVNVTVHRYLRRGPPSPADVSAENPAQARAVASEVPFMKLVSSLVDKLFK